MKKFFLLALAFVSLTAFAQTNLFDASQASVISTWGAGDVNPTATWDATAGSLSITLNAAQPGWQWGNQVALGHNVDFDATKYYQVSFTMQATADCGGVTLKVDDNTGMIFENQTINLVANTPYNYSVVAVGKVGNNKKIIFDFGYGVQNTQITVSNIVIAETAAPVFNGCTEGAGFKATSGDAALGHDGDLTTRWESAFNDNQKWQMNLSEAVTFNRVKIVWEAAYGKSFNINAGTACDNLHAIATITDQVLEGFPYTQIIELDSTVTASSIQFEGIARGTGYGFSFFEFEVYTAQTSVLTSLDFTAAAAIAQAGEGTVALTATPKDQYGSTMEAEVAYAVSPAAAGHVTNGVYYADAAGLATITATAGSINKQVTIFNYSGENVALNKTVTGEAFNELSRVNDGNDGTDLQCDPDNGGAGKEITCGFTIDLGAAYDLSLVTIHFEGACSDAYTLETSLDNEAFALAHSFTGTLNINNHTDFLFGDNLQNASNVRYLKFTSTKSSTQWGMKIFEFQAFGELVGPTTSLNEAETIHGKAIKFIENGQLFIMKNGQLYNAQGQLMK